MEKEKPYTPVACNFVDEIELFAIKKEPVNLVYYKDGDQITIRTTIKTWTTRNKEEFLITTDGLEIRLDYIVRINDLILDGSCGMPPDQI